jgi:hypothetical protein
LGCSSFFYFTKEKWCSLAINIVIVKFRKREKRDNCSILV